MTTHSVLRQRHEASVQGARSEERVGAAPYGQDSSTRPGEPVYDAVVASTNCLRQIPTRRSDAGAQPAEWGT
jgi:hypothetical protein